MVLLFDLYSTLPQMPAGFKKYKRAVAAAEWSLAAKAGGLIHKMTLLNFTLGWLAILAVRLLR